MRKLIAMGILIGAMAWMAPPAGANSWTCTWFGDTMYRCHDEYGNPYTCLVFGNMTRCHDN